jgi:hypothetical protein
MWRYVCPRQLEVTVAIMCIIVRVIVYFKACPKLEGHVPKDVLADEQQAGS